MGELVVYSEPPEWYDEVPRSITRQVIFGISLLVFAFGGFGALGLQSAFGGRRYFPRQLCCYRKQQDRAALGGGHH